MFNNIGENNYLSQKHTWALRWTGNVAKKKEAMNAKKNLVEKHLGDIHIEIENEMIE